MNKKIKKYLSLSSIVIGTGTVGNTAIIYTDLNPDLITISEIGDLDTMQINFNNDAIVDLTITQNNWSFDSVNIIEGSFIYNNIQTYGYSNFYLASALSCGEMIGNSQNFGQGVSYVWNRNFLFWYSYYSSIRGGEWDNVSDKYLGVRFQDSFGQDYYGWARLDVSIDTSGSIYDLKIKTIIKDYAYESVPNTQIKAGDKGSSSIFLCPSIFNQSIQICDSFLLNGIIYYQSSTISDTIYNGSVSGSDSIINTNVIIYPSPVVTIIEDTIICLGDQVVLSGTGAQTYTWNNGVVDGVSFTPTSTLQYEVTGVDTNSCVNKDTVLVLVNLLPIVNAGIDSVICLNENIILTGSGAQTYTWNNGIVDGISFTPTITQSYEVTGVDNNGCVNKDSVSVNVNPLPNVTANTTDSSICLNETIILTGSGAQNYIWNNGVIDGQSHIPTISQYYNVLGTDINGCINTDSVFIEVYDTIPTAEFSYQLTGFEVSLLDSSSNDVNYWYWTIDNDSISKGDSAQHLFTQNGTYEMCLIASNDCFSDTLCKQVTIRGVGINETLRQAQGDIVVYPNPVKDQLTIELKDVDKRITSVQLVDVSGRVVHFDKPSMTTSGKVSIDVSTLSQGVYIYTVISDEEIIGIGEVIKN